MNVQSLKPRCVLHILCMLCHASILQLLLADDLLCHNRTSDLVVMLHVYISLSCKNLWYSVLHAALCRSGETTGAIIIAEIVLMHVHEGIAGKSPSGKVIVDIDKYEPIARLGGNYYGRIKDVFELSRPNDTQMHKRAEQLRTQVGPFCHMQ